MLILMVVAASTAVPWPVVPADVFVSGTEVRSSAGGVFAKTLLINI